MSTAKSVACFVKGDCRARSCGRWSDRAVGSTIHFESFARRDHAARMAAAYTVIAHRRPDERRARGARCDGPLQPQFLRMGHEPVVFRAVAITRIFLLNYDGYFGVETDENKEKDLGQRDADDE
jgi:hypothetical protein